LHASVLQPGALDLRVDSGRIGGVRVLYVNNRATAKIDTGGTGDPEATQRWPIEMIPATLKISEKVRKYHFFPRKSMFVFLKNSTLLSIPSQISRWSLIAGRSGCIVRFGFSNDYGPTTNDCLKMLNARRAVLRLKIQSKITRDTTLP